MCPPIHQAETEAKCRLEHDVVDVEVVAKKRILYLEEWKLAASQRLDRLQTYLDQSVPRAEFEVVIKVCVRVCGCCEISHLSCGHRNETVKLEVMVMASRDSCHHVRALW